MALDPSILNDLDAMRAAGTLPPRGAAPAPIAPAAAAGPSYSSAGSMDFTGKSFVKRGPALAEQRAAAAAATGAKPQVAQLGRGARLARASIPGIVLGASAEGAYEKILETNQMAATPENRLERGLKILSGLNPVTAIMNMIEGDTKSPISRVGTPEFGVPAAGARPAAPAAAPVAAPAEPAAPAAAPIVKIANADGSVSFTNTKPNVQAQLEKGEVGTVMAAQPGVVTGQRGTFSVVPGVTPAERSRALSAAISDRQFALARGIANTPELVAKVEQAEEMFSAQEGVRVARTRAGRDRAEKRVAALLALQGVREQADAASTKAMADYLKSLPGAKKTEAEARRIDATDAALNVLVKSGRMSLEDATLVRAGITPERSTTQITPSMVPGGPTQVVTARPGRVPVEQTARKLLKIGETVPGPDGKPHIVQADGSLKPVK